MPDGTKSFGTLVVVAAVVWHLLAVLSPAWVLTYDTDRARDFGSYYYAVRVADEGGDPYDKKALNAAARADGLRGVHPFLYAPPFLLGMWWVRSLELQTAFHAWFWLHEALAVATALALWRWWRPLGRDVGWLLAALFALTTAVPNNHAMGQANFAGLLLAVLGLWQTDRERPGLGGVLMGLACMLKMSPAVFVFWWLVRREWVAAGAAIASAVLVSILTLPIAGLDVQSRFYTQILPTFSSGWYNGLAVEIGLFGNHSLPAFLDELFPGSGHVLTPVAQGLSTFVAIGLLAGLAFAFRRPEAGPLQRAAQAAAFGVVLLLLPVYTYEHHLVFAIPAAVLAVHGVLEDRLPKALAVPVGLAVGLLCLDLQDLRGLAESLPAGLAAVTAALRELKLLALLTLLATCAKLGTGAPAGPPVGPA